MTLRTLGLSLAFIALFALGAAAQDMPHEEVPFACARCHTDSDEAPIDFDHEETGFVLTGRHALAACRDCHDLADFSKIVNDCRTCHTDVHQARLYPECGTCHDPGNLTIIDPYTVHENTSFQLMGAHVRVDCGSCHTREIYAEYERIASTCYDCHRADFQEAQDPAHNEQDFGTGCEACHTQFGWHPGMLGGHPGAFPIYSGAHAGEWDRCSTCHIDPGNYSEFSCFECHKHNQSDMDDEHEEVQGYFYDSYSCFVCHPDGQVHEHDDR
jgi:hypothetical protein